MKADDELKPTYLITHKERFPCRSIYLGGKPLWLGRLASSDVAVEELSLYARVKIDPMHWCDVARLAEAIDIQERSDPRSRREFSLMVAGRQPGLFPLLAGIRAISELRILDVWTGEAFVREPARFDHLRSLSFDYAEAYDAALPAALLPRLPSIRHVHVSSGMPGLAFIDATLSWERLETVSLLGGLEPAEMWPWMERLARCPDLSLFVQEVEDWRSPAESARFVNELSRRWSGRSLHIRTASEDVARRMGCGLSHHGKPKMPRIASYPAVPPDGRRRSILPPKWEWQRYLRQKRSAKALLKGRSGPTILS